MGWKQAVNYALGRFGYEIRRITPGRDPLEDMRRIAGTNRPVVFDVGANVGQTIDELKAAFDQPEIHAFEPGRETFRQLAEGKKGIPGVTLNNVALGAARGTLDFMENSESVMSSFLELGQDGWGAVTERVPVTVRTVDDYCAEHGLDHIDVLKSDTQGFDLEVLKGAKEMIARRRIHMVFMEVTMLELYKGLPDLDDVYSFMKENGFALVSFYRTMYRGNRSGWTDVLFVDPEFRATEAAPTA